VHRRLLFLALSPRPKAAHMLGRLSTPRVLASHLGVASLLRGDELIALISGLLRHGGRLTCVREAAAHILHFPALLHSQHGLLVLGGKLRVPLWIVIRASLLSCAAGPLMRHLFLLALLLGGEAQVEGSGSLGRV